MSAGLIARNINNELLFDTRSISYGLVKSGTLTYVENWKRLRLRGINVDPNIGSSWVDRPVGDDQWGFTVSNTISPIVFLVGKGVVTGVKVVDSNTKTFLFACANQDTKYYCFDLMRDDSIIGPGLKTRDINGNVTFNSRQVPLNVISAIQAPTYGPLDSYGRPILTYIGGRNELIAHNGPTTPGITHCVVDIPLDAGSEYAAFLPWNRSCGIISDVSGHSGWDIYGVSEGAYGRTGGISFMFGPPGRTTQDQWTQTRQSYISYHLLPVIYPTALVIRTNNLPFPFN